MVGSSQVFCFISHDSSHTANFDEGIIDVQKFLPWMRRGNKKLLLDDLDDLEEILRKRGVLPTKDAVDVEIYDRVSRIKRKVRQLLV